MMATESLRGRSDEATLTSQPDPAINLDTDSNDAGAEQPHVNGDSAGSSISATDDLENKHIVDIVDDLVRSTDVSISGGSDNEASKGDASKTKDGDDKGHARALSSVKKPAAFKSISVNQKFLTVKSSAPAAPTKSSDKAAAATGSTSASSGTLTSSRPRLVVKSTSGLVSKSSSSANGGKPGGAPDASVVWNKNRPVPPPEPKNYTDEELKKYGIHMASRLGNDESKGGQNWADIDDDDEDWATDVITWKDGTKIEIPHADEHQHAPGPEPAPVASPAPAPAPLPAPAPTSAPRLALKPNGIPEKPKLVTTGSSQSVIRPGVLASGKGLVLKGAPEKPTLVAKPPAPPAPVKSPWASIPKVETASPVSTEPPSNHLGPRQLSRELAAANSITPPPPKEIAADDFSRTTRREGSTSTNRELYNSQSGRYEPVQDRRNSLRPELQHSRQPAVLQRGAGHEQQGPLDPNAPYGRRRGSSNVSGGSGSYMNRLRTHDQSLPPPELIHARRGSMTGRSDSPASPRAHSPSGQHGPPRGAAWAPRASPAMSHVSPFQHHAQPAEVRSMPPAVQVPPAPSEDEVELQKKIMRAAREEAMKRRLEEEAKEEAARKERIRLKLEALGPAPESKSQKKAAAKEQALTPTHIQARELPKAAADGQKVADNAPSAPTAGETSKPDAGPNGVAAQVPPSPVSVDAPSQAQNAGAPPLQWSNAPKQPERYPAATTWGAQPTVNNVWGAPNNNNRGLGNGTFNLASQPPSISTKADPGPIAPPSVLRASEPVPDAVITTRLPPIGPPKQAQAPGRLARSDRDAIASAWTAAVKTSDDDFTQMLNKQYQARDRQLQAEGRTLADAQPVIKDTWRPTQIDDKGFRNETAPKQSMQHGGDSSWVTASLDGKPQAPLAGIIASQASVSVPEVVPASILPPGAAPQPTRGSRFFPPQRERQDVAVEPAHRPDSPSPPPPDMAGHPAFDGDVAHPHVSLPRPPVVVRLPPSIPTEPRGASRGKPSTQPTGAPASHAPSFGGAAYPAYKEEGHSAQTENWQQKFNALLGRERHALPRSPVEHSSPRGHDGFNAHLWATSGKDGSVTSKVRDEECFEEQEMGSLPPVHLPHGDTAPEIAYYPSPLPKPLPRRLHAVPSSVDPLYMGNPESSSTGQHVWRVSFPGFSKNIYVAPPLEQSRSNSRRGGARGGARPPPSGPQRDQPRGGKSRDTSYTHPSEHRPGPTSNPSQTRGARGTYRGGGRGDWSRSNAIQT